MTTPYDVEVTRDGQSWALRIPALNRSTQARSIEEIDEMARDLVASMTDTDAALVALNILLPDDA